MGLRLKEMGVEIFSLTAILTDPKQPSFEVELKLETNFVPAGVSKTRAFRLVPPNLKMSNNPIQVFMSRRTRS